MEKIIKFTHRKNRETKKNGRKDKIKKKKLIWLDRYILLSFIFNNYYFGPVEGPNCGCRHFM